MTEQTSVDVAIVGAGFGGSLTALLLQRIGLRVLLLDRGSHPRFAIGESSTPIADLVLRDLARRYELPFLLSLSRYGTWKATYPELTCGLKRGFSYFYHQPGEPFRPSADHANELLVAASSSDAHADTHWLRSDVDTFLVQQVQAAGIPYYDQTEISVLQHAPTWQLTGTRKQAALAIKAEFLIDATGSAGFLPQALKLTSQTHQLRTHSRALFAHCEGVTPWQEMLVSQHADTTDHPFRCDAAALHHLLEVGWMWQLRFDNGVTSVGFALDAQRCRLNPTISAEEEWNALLARYPTLAQQLASARVVAPDGGLVRTGRLQRQWKQTAGPNWALLPHTAGFIDPLYSPGLAQTICGVERLVDLLERHWGRESLVKQLGQYERTLEAELDLIDELVYGSYRCVENFDLFVPYSMLYFAAATSYEQQRLDAGFNPERAFLCADHSGFRAVVRDTRHQLELALAAGGAPRSAERFFQEVAQAIAPFNDAGLCAPAVNNMYRYTAVF